MADLFTGIRTIWIDYSYYTVNLVLYWMALAWLLLFDKERKKNQMLLLAVIVPAMIVLFQTANQVTGGGRAFDKLFFLLPTMSLLAYTGVRITEAEQPRKNTWIIILLYAIIIQSGLGLQYDLSVVQGGNHSYKVSTTAGRLADFVEADEAVTDPFLLAPDDISVQIREYDSHIRVAYGAGYAYQYSSDFLNQEGLEAFLQSVEQYGCNMFIIPWEADDDDSYIQSLGYRMVAQYDGYALYALRG
jgi:hypothetical protein